MLHFLLELGIGAHEPTQRILEASRIRLTIQRNWDKVLSKITVRLFRLLRFQEFQFPRNLFGRVPLASREQYSRLHQEALSVPFPTVDAFEQSTGYAVKSSWLNNLALHTQVVIKKSDLNWQHGRVLYSALRKRLESLRTGESQRAQAVIFETGTARGFSAACMARAIIDSKQPGTVFTMDILPHNTPMMWNCIDDHDGPKSRQELLKPWAEEISRVAFLQGWTGRSVTSVGLSRIHFAFLDAQHTYAEVMAEYDYVRKRQKLGDVIVFDDVSVATYDGVVKAVDAIEREGLYTVTRLVASDQRGYALAERST